MWRMNKIMARKLKCAEDEIAVPIKTAKNALKMIPDPTKATEAQMKKVFEKTINEPDGCMPKGKGGTGAKTKEYFEHYRAIEKQTGKKFKDIGK